MKKSVAIETLYWHSVHGVMIMKKYIEDKPFASDKNCLNESQYNQGRNGSVGPKQKL
jgi:hypothetical protein